MAHQARPRNRAPRVVPADRPLVRSAALAAADGWRAPRACARCRADRAGRRPAGGRDPRPDHLAQPVHRQPDLRRDGGAFAGRTPRPPARSRGARGDRRRAAVGESAGRAAAADAAAGDALGSACSCSAIRRTTSRPPSGASRRWRRAPARARPNSATTTSPARMATGCCSFRSPAMCTAIST